jgi:ubiquinone/menaquinone biosynthesis C-methylase UbiE
MTLSFLNPEEILSKLSLEDNMIVADFGCGSGGWVIPLSEKIDGEKIYAIDISEESLSVLEGKLKVKKIENINILKEDVEKKTSLQNNYCDLILMTNLLHGVKNMKKVVKEGSRVLRKGGTLLVSDWKISVLGNDLVPSKEIIKTAEGLGFKLSKEIDSGKYHYSLIFKKS